MKRWFVRQILKAAIIVLAVFGLSGPDHRERERFMIESNEFLALFDVALAERGTDAKLHKLVDLCKANPTHLAHLRHEAASSDPRRALMAKAALVWIEKLPVLQQVVRYLTKLPPADVYPGGEAPVSFANIQWHALAVVKHVGAEASIPLLEFVARYPDTRLAQGASLALVDLWDASIMDGPLFAMFGDTSYSDRYRLSIASSFARKSKMPYVAALRHMLIAPETSKTELDTIVLILADLHDIESIPHMRAIFLDESASSWLRREALDALDSLGAPDVLQLSLHVYPSLDPDTGDREVLHAIVRAFSKYGDTRVVPLLKKLTKDPGPFNDLASMAKEAMDANRTRAKATPRLDASAE
jgi:hypothetical protein